MAKPNSSPHGVGDIIVTINEEFQNKFGKKLVVEDTGRVARANGRNFGLLNQTATEDSDSRGVATNGEVLLAVGENTSSIYQYEFGSPYDVTTLSYTQKLVDVGGQDSSPKDITTNGKKLILSGSETDSYYSYSFGSQWDISTLSYDGASYSFGDDVLLAALGVVSDGDKLISSGNGGFYQYNLQTDWDVSGMSLNEVKRLTAGPDSMYTNGEIIYTSNSGADVVYQHRFGEPYDVTTISYEANAEVTEPHGLESTDDNLIVVDGSTVESWIYRSKISLP